MKFTKINNRCYFNPESEIIAEATGRGAKIEEFNWNPVHVQIGDVIENWILWENGEITRIWPWDCPDSLVKKIKKNRASVVGFPDHWNYEYESLLKILSPSAIILINQLDGADISGVEESIATITDIEEIISEKVCMAQPGKEYMGRELKELVVKLKNGQVEKRFVFCLGYFEGYQFYVYKSFGRARAKFEGNQFLK